MHTLSRLMMMPITLAILMVLLGITIFKTLKGLMSAPMDKSNLQTVVDHTQRWEGGLSRDKNDTASKYPCPTPFNGKTGWHTNKGVTYQTWVSIFGKYKDSKFLNMSNADWFKCYSKYWDGMKAPQVKDWRIGVTMAQFAWGSGVHGGSRLVQKILNKHGAKLNVDGKIGQATIDEINKRNPAKLFKQLVDGRKEFFVNLANSGSNYATFLKGWLNRLDDFEKTFKP